MMLAKVIVAMVAISSCAYAETRWEETAIDGPWVAPGIHARELTRTSLHFYSPVAEHDTFWTTANGARKDADKIIDSTMRYLEKLGYFDRWPKTGFGFDDYDRRLAPFTFHIIAIEPIIVTMVPHDFGSQVVGKSGTQILGPRPKQGVSSKFMMNYIEYGTSLLYHPDVLWFSPDLRIPPTPLSRYSDSEQSIDHKKVHLVFTRDGDRWVTKRTPNASADKREQASSVTNNELPPIHWTGIGLN